jgi:hypothetical protein
LRRILLEVFLLEVFLLEVESSSKYLLEVFLLEVFLLELETSSKYLLEVFLLELFLLEPNWRNGILLFISDEEESCLFLFCSYLSQAGAPTFCARARHLATAMRTSLK